MVYFFKIVCLNFNEDHVESIYQFSEPDYPSNIESSWILERVISCFCLFLKVSVTQRIEIKV